MHVEVKGGHAVAPLPNLPHKHTLQGVVGAATGAGIIIGAYFAFYSTAKQCLRKTTSLSEGVCVFTCALMVNVDVRVRERVRTSTYVVLRLMFLSVHCLKLWRHMCCPFRDLSLVPHPLTSVPHAWCSGTTPRPVGLDVDGNARALIMHMRARGLFPFVG